MIQRYKPMLAKEKDEPFNDKDWLFEIKWDGFRTIAYVNEEVSLKSRNGKELKDNFPELSELKKLTSEAVLDGEIVIVKEKKANFQAMLERAKVVMPIEAELRSARTPAVYVIFDILEKDGKSLLDLPLIERKKILSKSVKEGPHVLLSDYIEEKGEAYYEAAIEKNLEGIMAKKKTSTYQPGIRSSSWLKIKKLRTCDCVITGFTKGSGARKGTLGALLLGLYDENKKLNYVGKVGTGFTQNTLKSLIGQFQGLQTDESPFETNEVSEKVIWLKPKLVCEVIYQTITHEGSLRMARFRGIREDKDPNECTLDQLAQNRLGHYQAKRDFSKTTEPVGAITKEQEEKIFVIQEHHSRRLHYDFRLENAGVLRSWAVPKGIPNNPEEKHLAVETENHPLEYATFAGTIPPGEYGAGTVKIWDKGTYKIKVWNDKMVEVILAGKRLNGRYVLVKLKAGEKNWLMLKARD
jgi:DNA ligase D-like protein (predicted ligase)/DNA ligase D-like protein (predicted 3'-phosphoesterase)